jgi:hypothetical protein
MATTFLDNLETAAREAERAEAAFRSEVAARVAALERDRAFAYRRLNLMKAIADAARQAEEEQPAIAYALAVLRNKLGWESDSDARAAVLTRFAPVAQAIYSSYEEQQEQPDKSDQNAVSAALMAFEAWYAETHPTPFWVLFEHYIPETPRTDF